VYAIGNLALLGARKLTAVGSRRTPTQACAIGKDIAKELSKYFAVVTGVAEGGDSAIIEGALAGTGDVICVLAGGLNDLPQGNFTLLERVAKKGLILSPYPMDTAVRSFSYEYRNKLIASLGLATFVLSAGEKSGTLITAKHAKREKKPLFALPYAPWQTAGAGCNALIKEGAVLTESAEDILRTFGIERQEEKAQVPLSDEEQRIFDAIKTAGEIHANALAQTTGVPVFKMRAVLASLEVKGVIIAVGGNRYSAL
jgi:DNA processing protein